MTIQIRGKTNPVIAADDTPTVAVPAGTVDGDFMLLSCSRNQASFSVLYPPPGWHAIPGALSCGANDLQVYYRIANSEPADYTFRLPDPTGNITYAGIITLYSDTASGIKFDPGQVGMQYNVSSGNRVWPTLTLSAAGMLLCFGSFTSNFSTVPPGGTTEQWDVAGPPRAYLMTETVASGATGTRTATGTALISRCISIALIEGAFTYLPGPQFRSYTDPDISTVNGSKSLAVPADLVAGDLMLLHVAFSTVDRTPACAGWVLKDSLSGTSSIYIFEKFAVAGDLGSTVTVTFAAGSVNCGLGIIAFYSPRGLGMLIDHHSNSDNVSSANRLFAAVTPTVDNALMVGLATIAGTANSSVPDPSIMAERYDYNSGIRMNFWHEAIPLLGTTGTRTTTGTAMASRTVSLSIVELQSVTAEFSGTPLTGYGSLNVTFTDLSTGDGAAVVGWQWTFGDGDTDTAQNPTHMYASPGTYTVTLEVNDGGSLTDTETKVAYVVVDTPTVSAEFSGTPLLGTSTLNVAFTDLSTDTGTTIVDWLWDFGDGDNSALQNPTHNYLAPGTYTVTLTVDDLAGAVDSEIKVAYVIVSAPITVVGLRPNKSGQEHWYGLDEDNLYPSPKKID